MKVSTSVAHYSYDKNGIIRPIIGSYDLKLMDIRSLFTVIFLLILFYENFIKKTKIPKRLLYYLLKYHFNSSVKYRDTLFDACLSKVMRILNLSADNPLLLQITNKPRTGGAGALSVGNETLISSDRHLIFFNKSDITKPITIGTTVEKVFICESDASAQKLLEPFSTEIFEKKNVSSSLFIRNA